MAYYSFTSWVFCYEGAVEKSRSMEDT